MVYTFQGVVDLPGLLVTEAFLSFIDLGVNPPTPLQGAQD